MTQCMKCRECGTDIADKALICFRCGTAATEAKFSAQPTRRALSGPMLLGSATALALLVLLGMYMGQMASGAAPRTVGYVAIAFAAAVVALRAIARRR